MRALFLAFLPLALLSATACAKGGAASGRKDYCRVAVFEGSRFTVCDNQGGEMLLFAAGKGEQPLRSFAEVSKRIDPQRVAFAMNAGMFDDHGRPIGLAEIAGKQAHKVNTNSGPGNFHLLPNGVFMILCGGRAAIFQSDMIPEFRCAPRLSTQSGPMLVINGKLHPKFDRDGQSRNIRNGVGVTTDGKALFVISEDEVSFGKLARFFRDALHTPDALYFDGVVSSLWDPGAGRRDADAELGPIIVALKPAAPNRDPAAKRGTPAARPGARP
jgi:uncharacterized protein YigE (DUF2233 family)